MNNCINLISILISLFTAYMTFRMYRIAKGQIVPKVNSLSSVLERTKKEQIYEKCFASMQMDEDEFDNAVKKAYKKIERLIPDLDDEGRAREDWHLGKWLREERPHYITIKKMKETEEIAELISKIRMVK